MNLPNKITLARIFMIPIFMIALMCGNYYGLRYYTVVSAVLFAAAALTDGIDGHIARSRGLITDFGKFLDPLADKLLVSAGRFKHTKRHGFITCRSKALCFL